MRTGETWRQGHRPALDGIRGTAVLLVVAFHAGAPLPSAGSVGVAMFFVLSGYLIGGQLVGEHERANRVDVRRFLTRRARRLVPALVAWAAAMYVLGCAAPWFINPDLVPLTLTWVQNYAIAGGVQMGPLTPTWTLAVEAQFYVLAVALAAGSLRAWGRTGFGVACAIIIAASLALRFTTGDYTAGYVSTGTNLYALFGGALLATARVTAPRWTWWTLAAAAPLVTLDAALWVPVVAATATGLAITAPAPQWAEARWLTLVGRRSYGLYLWHAPCTYFAVLVAVPLGVNPWTAAAVAVALSWALTLASWRYVEQPWTQGSPYSETVVPATNCPAPPTVSVTDVIAFVENHSMPDEPITAVVDEPAS